MVRNPKASSKRSTEPEITEEVSYYICSRTEDEISPQALADAIRGHWAIENKLHYRKDRTFDEDRPQVRGKSAARIMSVMRSVAIHCLCPNSSKTLPQMQNILLTNLGTCDPNLKYEKHKYRCNYDNRRG